MHLGTVQMPEPREQCSHLAMQASSCACPCLCALYERHMRMHVARAYLPGRHAAAGEGRGGRGGGEENYSPHLAIEQSKTQLNLILGGTGMDGETCRVRWAVQVRSPPLRRPASMGSCTVKGRPGTIVDSRTRSFPSSRGLSFTNGMCLGIAAILPASHASCV